MTEACQPLYSSKLSFRRATNQGRSLSRLSRQKGRGGRGTQPCSQHVWSSAWLSRRNDLTPKPPASGASSGAWWLARPSKDPHNPRVPARTAPSRPKRALPKRVPFLMDRFLDS
jgi:hypothetical protein